MNEYLNPPVGWSSATLGDALLAVIGGGTPSRRVPAYFVGFIPWFTVKDLKSPKPSDAQEHISELAIADSATNLIPAHTLIVATRIALGKAIRPTVACAINQDLKALILGSGMHPDFLLHWIGANERVIQDLGSGTTVSGIRLEALHSLPLNVPPAAEQTRIVAKLEELLSDLDAGVAELKAAQKKLAQYRQSLLKAAVEGALTADWRAAQAVHPAAAPAESGSALLARILAERRSRWQARQRAKFQAQGKTPPKDWQAKYPEPVAPDTTGLPELPQGWVWASVEQLTVEQKYGTSAKTDSNSAGVPVIRMGNIQDGELDLDVLKYLPVCHDEFPALHLEDGDLLFNRTNSPELVGKTAVYRSQIVPCSYASYLIGIRFSSWYVPEFASAFINSVYGRNWVKSVVTQQVGQANVNGTKLAALAIPLPPFAEQQEVMQALSVQRASAFAQKKHVDFSLKQSAAQRKNILQAAFSGQLVPQNPADEPASVLLAGIRAERAGRAAAGPVRSKKKEPA